MVRSKRMAWFRDGERIELGDFMDFIEREDFADFSYFTYLGYFCYQVGRCFFDEDFSYYVLVFGYSSVGMAFGSINIYFYYDFLFDLTTLLFPGDNFSYFFAEACRELLFYLPSSMFLNFRPGEMRIF